MRPVPPPAVPEWTLADRLRKARGDAGYSQAELATVTGISRQSINRYETGRAVPDRSKLLAWATACHVDYEWLTGGSPEDQLLSVKNLPPAVKRYLADRVRAGTAVKRPA